MAVGTVRNEGFDHMTVVVADLGAARRFFGLLGFDEKLSVVARGDEIARYMGIEDWEADHVTLVLEGAPVHQEVQLLRFHHPPALPDEARWPLELLEPLAAAVACTSSSAATAGDSSSPTTSAESAAPSASSSASGLTW